MFDPEPGADDLRKGAALIRQQFHIDPYTLDDETFSERLAEALWLKKFDQELLEGALSRVIAKAFGTDKQA